MPSNNSVPTGLALLKVGDKSKVLGLTIGSHAVEPGLYVPRADAQKAPQLHFDVPDPNGTYLVMGLDIDAPFPSCTVLGPILHWIQPGLKSEKGSGPPGLKAVGSSVVSYIGPGPPPGSAPHRYCFFLYEQPAGFDAAAHEGVIVGNWARMRFSLDDWERKTQLGPILAANYFTSN
ncbi:phosphatidylethanolamine-binding protein [Hirsutella rhossiliensis]|uniref:Phosphatidylethanolamine-binding protein n=1 Tax=Hirsutella rhossiliensis TaxID=111463 RepID=A0A9P8MWN7_9HYPO|nr:phosphatidylethanolamine-binding protein [Hirsutella rhossiliensis]KAH0963653.1 phosphatidylethanolamine-binding protein [Hirsutella rhossiliensis]